MTTKPAEELDGRIAMAFSEDQCRSRAMWLACSPRSKTVGLRRRSGGRDGAGPALDLLLSGDTQPARCEMDDAAFKQDRLQEASAKLAERVEALKALEADRRMWEEYRPSLKVERDQLAEAMERMANPIVQIAHTVKRIEICDREIGRLNATSTARFGHIDQHVAGRSSRTAALFQDAVVWDAFIAVARLPVVSRRLFLDGLSFGRQALRPFSSSPDAGSRPCQDDRQTPESDQPATFFSSGRKYRPSTGRFWLSSPSSRRRRRRGVDENPRQARQDSKPRGNGHRQGPRPV